MANLYERFINDQYGTNLDSATERNSLLAEPHSTSFPAQASHLRMLEDQKSLENSIFSQVPTRRATTDSDMSFGPISDLNGPLNLAYGVSGPSTDQKGPTSRRLQPVSLLPSKQALAFNFENFNQVQSEVLETAYFSDENFVVSAPTGAGKTVSLDLALLRLFSSYHKEGWTSGKVKAVYVCPLKALCQERRLDWETRLQLVFPNLRVTELTGDTGSVSFSNLKHIDLICTTPEKWDSLTRGWKSEGSTAFVQSIGLLLIDEVHLLHEERGACIEAFVSRMKTISEIRKQQKTESSYPVARLRIITLSATIPNADSCAKWIEGRSFVFGPEFRPVPLRLEVVGVRAWSKQSANIFMFEKSLDRKLGGVIQDHSDGKPTLIFCSTKNGCASAAKAVLESVVGSRLIRGGQQLQRLKQAAARLHDSSLAALVRQGTAVHHAGLTSSDRRIVEGLFLCSDLLVLASTTTLAMGVNLPAHLVIIRGTWRYAGKQGYKKYEKSTLLQLMGRAGRPQFDKEGACVILTRDTEAEEYRSLDQAADVVESQFHRKLLMHLNAEVANSSILDPAQAISWIKSSFLYQRLLANPRHYGLLPNASKDIVNQHVKKVTLQHIKQLHEARFLEYDEFLTCFQPTTLGKVIARFYLACDTGVKFQKILEEAAKLQGTVDDLVPIILESMCGLDKEFDMCKIRLGEKQYLNAMLKGKKVKGTDRPFPKPRYGFKGTTKTDQQKVWLLLQAKLSRVPGLPFRLRNDADSILKIFRKLAQALAVYVEKTTPSMDTILATRQICRIVFRGVWGDDGQELLLAPGIGPAKLEKFKLKGLTCIEDLKKLNGRLSSQVRELMPAAAANKVVAYVQSIPFVDVEVQAYDNEPHKFEVQLHQLNHEYRPNDDTCWLTLVVGDDDKEIYVCQRLRVSSRSWTHSRTVQCKSSSRSLRVMLISDVTGSNDIDDLYPLAGSPHQDDPPQLSNAEQSQPTAATTTELNSLHLGTTPPTSDVSRKRARDFEDREALLEQKMTQQHRKSTESKCKHTFPKCLQGKCTHACCNSLKLDAERQRRANQVTSVQQLAGFARPSSSGFAVAGASERDVYSNFMVRVWRLVTTGLNVSFQHMQQRVGLNTMKTSLDGHTTLLQEPGASVSTSTVADFVSQLHTFLG